MNLLIEKYKKYEPFFGNWYIKSLLGEGAFGAVFEIEREDFGIKYSSALKIVSIPQSESELEYIKDEGMDEDATSKYYEDILMRMMNEFALMSKMRGHSNIVSYEDHQIIPHEGSIGWDILIRMELLTPIRKWQENHPMSEKDVIELGIDICDALEVCKKYNIIHRDIKPENIFVSSSDNYKLGDFGIARTMENTRGASTKAGTGRYMAPEVYRGERYNDTVDIYSLGLVLYRYLNDNRAPFLPPYPQPIKFSDQEMAQEKRLNGERLPKATHASDGIMDVINKACQFKPNDRYYSASEMKKELLSLQSKIGATAEKVSNNENVSSESNICEDKNTEKSVVESKEAENNSIISNNESIEVCKEDTHEKESEPVSLPTEDENDLTELVSNEEKTVGYFNDIPLKKVSKDKRSDDSGAIKIKHGTSKMVFAVLFLLISISFAVVSLFKDKIVLDSTRSAAQEVENNELIEQIAVGDVITFGSYKDTPLSWYVIDKNDDMATLLCANAIEAREFDMVKSNEWDKSSIRQWLNYTFYDNAFSIEEKAIIKSYGMPTTLSGIREYDSVCDRVFLLSEEDYENYRTYFKCDKNWWLRTHSDDRDKVKFYNVRTSRIEEINADNKSIWVRPTIRIGYSSDTDSRLEYVDIDIKKISIGDVVTFGELSGEPLSWYVVDKDNDKATLLSVNSVADKIFNEEAPYISWRDSSLRTWLNEDFYKEAFSFGEKMIIKPSHNKDFFFLIDNYGNKARTTNWTIDKVYILSVDEAKKYEKYCYSDRSWWLRNQGKEVNKVLFTYDIGTIDNNGLDAWNYSLGVRPVIQIGN